MSKQLSKRKVVLRGQETHDHSNHLGSKSHQFNMPGRVWSGNRNSNISHPIIDHRHDRSVHLINSNYPQKKRPPLLETPSSLHSRPKINTLGGLSGQKHVPVEKKMYPKHSPSTKWQKSVQRSAVARSLVNRGSPLQNATSCNSVSNRKHAIFYREAIRDNTIEGSTGSTVYSYDNQSFDDISSSASSSKIFEVSPKTYKRSFQGSDNNCQSINCHEVHLDPQTATSKHLDHVQFLDAHQDSENDRKRTAELGSGSIHNDSSTKAGASSELPIALNASIDNQSSSPTPGSKSRLTISAATVSDDPKSNKTPSEELKVEYVVLTPKSTKSTRKTKSQPVKDNKSNFSENTNDMLVKNCDLALQQQTVQPLDPGCQLTFQPDLPYPNYPVQQISANISHQKFSLQNYPVHQQPLIPAQSSLQYLTATGSYAARPNAISDTGPVPEVSEFVNPYRCLVTPQYPILNVPATADPSFYIEDNVITPTAETTNTLQSVPPGNVQNAVTNYQVSSEMTFGYEEMSGSENKSISISDREEVNHGEVQNKRIRKERPTTPKSHIKPDHLFNLIESVHDIQQLTAASNIVREIIRVLPLKRNASVSWVDKETILHAIDELGEQFENHIKLQIRRSVLRYGFQVINPNFVPDVTNTKCDIGDDEFANKYKMSKGFVKETNRDSDSGSDLEQARRLVDSKYYACWISREYCKHICMQRLSVKAKGDKGEPISFKGFKWGHSQLTADLETSFVVRPEHRVAFYQWLSKSVPKKPPKRKYGTKPGQPDHLIMKVNLTKPKSGLKGLPLNLCECEFWEFNGTNKRCSVSYKYPKGMNKVTVFLAENHPLQPVTFDKTKLQQIIFDCD